MIVTSLKPKARSRNASCVTVVVEQGNLIDRPECKDWRDNAIFGHVKMQRIFLEVPDNLVGDFEELSYMAGIRSSNLIWEDLLKSQRVLIISEAGAGKTFECQEQKKRLWCQGEPAFFLELSVLATTNVRDMLGPEEELRFDSWLNTES